VSGSFYTQPFPSIHARRFCAASGAAFPSACPLDRNCGKFCRNWPREPSKLHASVADHATIAGDILQAEWLSAMVDSTWREQNVNLDS
jgi:hypothetical protein